MARRTQTIMALAVGTGCIIPGQSAAARQAHPIIGVLVINEAGVASNVLTVARAEATRIYHGVGIPLVWTDKDEGGIAHQFVVKIIPHALKGKAVDGGAMGIAPGTKERRGTVAYAFYDRIQNVTRAIAAEPGVILGHVIAHELGHLLLPYNAHATSGLMRGGWDTDQAMRAMRGTLTFNPHEAALIRQRLRNVDSRTTESAAMRYWY